MLLVILNRKADCATYYSIICKSIDHYLKFSYHNIRKIVFGNIIRTWSVKLYQVQCALNGILTNNIS
jgi:hypothetical protein